MKPYRPISCEIHSRYELLVIRHSKITLDYMDAGNSQQHATGTAIDLYTRNGEEFIDIQIDAETSLAIRLDRIISCKSC